MKQLVFATHNAHKLEEVAKMLDDMIQVVSLTDLRCTEEIPEKGFNLQSNALQKAQFVDERFKCDCFGDDTGLEVEALNGEPGVFSARYAGEPANSEANIEKLLKNLKGITNRNAQFRTVIALIYRQRIHYFEGVIKGRIIEEDDKTTNTYIIKETDLIFRRYIGEFTELNDTNIKLPLNILNNHMKIKKIII
jgi:XTP/dITP diphosphohydrolase